MENNKRFQSLSARKDFLRLRAEGRKFHVSSWLLVNLTVHKQNTERGQIRCGWTIPRQIGTAVVRNRLRRWGREYLRKWSAKNSCSLDLNLIFKRKEKGFYQSIAHKEFDEVMEKLVRKIGSNLE